MNMVFLQLDAPTAAARSSSANRTLSEAEGLLQKQSNLASAFLHVATHRAHQIALETSGPSYSYDEVMRAAQSVRLYLCDRPDFHPGMRVALRLSNSFEYVVAFYGALLADCVVVPLPVSIEKSRLLTIQELCSPQVIFCRYEDFGAAQVDPSADFLLLKDAARAIPPFLPRRSGDDLAMVLFTSGSTGSPKGVMLSHRNLLANAESILKDLPIRTDDKALVLVPFYHSFGNSILQTHIFAGATMVVGLKLVFPEAITQALLKFNATSFSAIPETYSRLLKYGKLGEQPLPNLRYMAVAGGEMPPALTEEMATRIAPATFHVMYGQSEASPRLASLAPDQIVRRRGSIGKPLVGIEFSVRDESGGGLPPLEVGMLYARGENVMLGYWNDPEQTATVLSDDGWLKTGDLAHYDNDGFFYLDGRANLLVKIQGHRVHPLEIEGFVEEKFPNTRAIALPMIKGEQTRFALFVVAQDSQLIDVAEISAACLRELPTYKVPAHFEIIEDFPLTSAGKVDRSALSVRIPKS